MQRTSRRSRGAEAALSRVPACVLKMRSRGRARRSYMRSARSPMGRYAYACTVYMSMHIGGRRGSKWSKKILLHQSRDLVALITVVQLAQKVLRSLNFGQGKSEVAPIGVVHPYAARSTVHTTLLAFFSETPRPRPPRPPRPKFVRTKENVRAHQGATAKVRTNEGPSVRADRWTSAPK